MTIDVGSTTVAESEFGEEPPPDCYRFRPEALRPGWFFPLAERSSFQGVLRVLVVTFGMASAAALAAGRLGSPGDFQPWLDLLRVSGSSSVPESDPDFPFFRDYPSMALLVLASLTLVLIPWQWRLLGEAIPDSVRSGVLTPKPAKPGDPHRDELASLTARVNRVAEFVGHWLWQALLLMAAAGLSALLIYGGQRSDLFGVLVPEGLAAEDRADWLTTTYNSWWASRSTLVGSATYGVLMTATLYAVLLQNIAGGLAIYYIKQIPGACDMREQPLAPDGRSGWAPMARGYRTVYFSLSLHAVAIGIIILVMGVGVAWVGGLLLLYTAAFLLYIFLPQVVFRKGITSWRRSEMERIARLATESAELDAVARAQADSWCRDEIRRLAEDPIAPLATTRARVVAIVLVAANLAIALAQTLLALPVAS